MTWLRDHPQKYDLGEEEFHLAFRTDDFDAAHALHESMECICFENPAIQFALLASDGMLVKRPILVGDGSVLVGFKEDEWRKRLI